MVECLTCGGNVNLKEDVVVGELLECPECGTELEIKSINPPIIEEAPQEEEDWGE